MKLSHLILFTSLAVLAAGAGAAAKPPTFKALDANGDGSLDTAEFAKATEGGVKQEFAKLDKNGDGKLSKSEYGVVMGDEDCE